MDISLSNIVKMNFESEPDPYEYRILFSWSV